jgi:hypothetical protein
MSRTCRADKHEITIRRVFAELGYSRREVSCIKSKFNANWIKSKHISPKAPCQ